MPIRPLHLYEVAMMIPFVLFWIGVALVAGSDAWALGAIIIVLAFTLELRAD